MYGTTASAELHARLVKSFGLPVLAQDEWPEMFGFYHMDDEPLHWHFEPNHKVWKVIKARKYNGHHIAPTDALDGVDKADVAEKIRNLSLMEPPHFPSDLYSVAEEAPFIYEGLAFQWMFFPELCRWEIAPLGQFE